MITLLIASIIAFITSGLKIKKQSGGKLIDFITFFAEPTSDCFIFLLSGLILSAYVLGLIIFLMHNGIIP